MNSPRMRFTASAPANVCTVLFSGVAAQAQQKPNIVYIVSDDQGWKDVGYHGSDIQTPNIEALAKEGARLEQFYAQPMCTPPPPYEKNNVAAANPEKVASLQNRANELAAQGAKPLFLTTEFQALRERLKLPPSLPGEEIQFDKE